MAVNSKEYWESRAVDRLVTSEKIATSAMLRTLQVYQRAYKNIQTSIDDLYLNYAEKGIVDLPLLKRALDNKGRKDFLKAIKNNAEKLGIDISETYDERFLMRLTRLEAIKEQIKLEIMTIAPQEEQITKKAYTRIVEGVYSETQNDLEFQGVEPAFSTIETKTLNSILSSTWEGGNYSSRIWGNVDELSQKVPELVGGAVLSGSSFEKVSAILRERFGVAKYQANRLIRTEANYFVNQSQLQAYADDEIEEYEFDAVMDKRTSSVCRNHNGQIYKISEAVVGVNYPPMHPNCRSTTVAVFENTNRYRGTSTESRKQRLAKSKRK